MIDAFVRWTRSRHSPTALFFASVAESTVVPIPIEIVMTPMMVADRARNWMFAFVVFAGCLAGSLAMYGVGYLAFETLGRWLIDAFAWQDAYAGFERYMAERGALAVAAIAITPIPLVVAAVGAGAAHMNVVVFLAVLAATRAVRYFGIALLVELLGPRAEWLLRRYTESVRVRVLVWAGTLLLVGLLAWGTSSSLLDGARPDGGAPVAGAAAPG